MSSKCIGRQALCRGEGRGTDPGSVLGRQGFGSKATGKAKVGAKESLQSEKTVKSGQAGGEMRNHSMSEVD